MTLGENFSRAVYDVLKVRSAFRSRGLQIGKRASNGGIYVGKSATTGEDLYAASADEPECLSYDEALEVAERMRQQSGRENAHVPTEAELDENLFCNRDKGLLKGSFDTKTGVPRNGFDPATGAKRSGGSCYRSSTTSVDGMVRVQWLDDGYQCDDKRSTPVRVRLVW